ncbi:MAG: barstar family protein [Lachnospiraceae bacterium]|nr:barstar family protein [Lachnospiraceae bacterium]
MDGRKKVIVLDAERMTDRESLHPYLREQMCFPDHYGNNFDALYDVLTEISCPTQIVLKGGEKLEGFGWFGRQVLRVFREAAEDNCCLSVELT